jgi:hypothetical protein
MCFLKLLQVTWQPYLDPYFTSIQLSSMCSIDENLYLMRCPLICFYAIEYHLPHRVARQFGLLKGKCALGPFLSILVIECQHMCFCANLCKVVDKVQTMSKGMFLDLVHCFMD